MAVMTQTITIDGEKYEVDRTVAGAIDEMQTEIETLRNALVRLAVFVGGNPCWCKCEGGKHSKVCRDTLKLKLWPRVTVNGRASYHNNLPWKDASQ
jgi:hypothetical protein